jgi:hypothetical protein
MLRDNVDDLLHFQSTQEQVRFQPDPYHLRAVAARLEELGKSYLEEDFCRRVRHAIISGLYRLDALPRSDSFWIGTNRRPTLGKLDTFAAQLLKSNPTDTEALWLHAALDVLDGAGVRRWPQLQAHGFLDAVWAINSAINDYWSYGLIHTSAELIRLVKERGWELEARARLEQARYSGEEQIERWAARIMQECPAPVDQTLLKLRGGIVSQIARNIQESGAFDALPILADALDEAGCENHSILEHCRVEVPHNRGCWVLGLLLGNE